MVTLSNEFKNAFFLAILINVFNQKVEIKVNKLKNKSSLHIASTNFGGLFYFFNAFLQALYFYSEYLLLSK